MKHLRNQIFICEKDITISDIIFKQGDWYKSDITFKQGDWYMSVGTCNDHISLVHDGKFIPVHSMDLLTHFKLVNSPEVLRYLMTMLEATKKNTYLREVSPVFVLDSLVDGAKLAMNTYKTVAV